MISHVNMTDRILVGRHLGRQRKRPSKRRPRSIVSVAALGYLARGRTNRGLIPVEELTLVVLYGNAIKPGRWLAGYSAQRVPWGVAWGGVERNTFLKDLCLAPTIGGRAAELDLQQAALVELARQLNQCLEQQRTQRLPAVQKRLELPRLWAGFEPAAARRIKCAGPELSALCRRRRQPARMLLRSARRRHQDLVLYPLEWVSHEWREMACVFADVGRFRKRQLFRLQDPAQDLVGYRGAAEFDFYRSRFRRDGY